jgi:WD40 repeat protein
VRAVACAEVDGVPVAVTAGDDGTGRVWDLRTGAVLTTLTGHDGSVRAVACGEVDGVAVAVTAGDDRTARVWDLLRPEKPLILNFPGLIGAVGTHEPEGGVVLAHGREVLAVSLKPATNGHTTHRPYRR